MKLDDPNAYTTATELEVIERTLSLEGARVLELGCGRALMTRQIAERCRPTGIVATEIDRVQHEKNLLLDDLPGVRFVYGGAEAIDLPDASIDVVIMLRSLHHVPVDLMDAAMREIHRVLQPGGALYVSEPVYRGDLNDIMKLFHDEKAVRQAAFDAVCRAVDAGLFSSAEQVFFNATSYYEDFAEFEERILKATHTRHDIDAALHQRIEAAFARHMGEDGACFLTPTRVDLLRKA